MLRTRQKNKKKARKTSENQWPSQEPIDWRYLPYISPTVCKAYVREYPHKIWPYMVQYLHFRTLEFPLSLKTGFFEKGAISIRKLINHQHVGIFIPIFRLLGSFIPKYGIDGIAFEGYGVCWPDEKWGWTSQLIPAILGAHEVPGVWVIAISIYKETDSWSRKKWDTLW